MPCHCASGWVYEQHPDLPWPHDDCAGPGMPCDEPACPYRIDTRPVKAFSGLVSPVSKAGPNPRVGY